MHLRPNLLFGLLLAFALTIGAVVLGTGAASTCTITVRPGDSIQSAIDRAPSGAIICLSAGIWEEPITINKSLTLRGSGANLTCLYQAERSEAGAVIEVTSSQEINVRIERLMVKGILRKYEGAELDELDLRPMERMLAEWRHDGVNADRSVSVTIVDSTLTLCDHAIILATVSQKPMPFEGHLSLVNSTISQSQAFGLYMVGGSASIVDSSFVENHDTMRVSGDGEIDAFNSRFDENQGPIDISGRVLASFSGCSISNNSESGIYIATGRGVSIVDSNIENNESNGVAALAGEVTITDSRISGNEGSGISVCWNSGITVTACTIADNGREHVSEYGVFRSGNGISIEDSAQATLVGNRITGNVMYGVAIDEEWGPFDGYVAGHGNTILEPAVAGGNQEGAVCPAGLGFLTTDAGGDLDLRPGS